VGQSEVNFQNIDVPLSGLSALLPEDEKARVDAFLALPSTAAAIAVIDDASKSGAEKAPHITNVHQSLKASSISYVKILEELRSQINLLPPSSALAGLYTLVDTTRGVWKAPANLSVSSVNAPAINISHEEQQDMNVDAISGKSVNVIRPFPGIGTLVWGARTLDGNSQDWRYVNVRRTLIMVEQSLKLATRSYVFEPNDAGTWVTISSMMNNFLYNLWKQGALAGAAPEEAYSVSIGLGATMTPTDILDGIMRITVKLAIVRPAEFIVITFQQQQQTS
jgi:phage tail sheath protein FI